MILVFAKVLVGEDIRDSNSTSREMIPPSIYGQGNMLLTASVVREERSCRIWSDGGESCAGSVVFGKAGGECEAPGEKQFHGD